MISVVLAGGSGTRFWPMSRRLRPKQLVSLWDDTTMIEAAVARLGAVSAPEQTFVVLGEHLVAATRRVLPEVGFIVEPCARNTAPAIGLAAIYAQHHFGDEPLGVFPADHYIGAGEGFSQCLRRAEEAARRGHIVTLGITPTSPETGYGYIHFDASDPARPGEEAPAAGAFPVRQFVEKPTRALARQYLDSGDYVWNSGMFIFKPSVLLDEMRRQLPQMHQRMMTIAAALGTSEERAVLEAEFSAIRGISVDYGIMENARDVVVLPATFTWSDVGHWDAVDQVHALDAHGNVVDADALLVDVTRSVIYSRDTGRLIAVCGVEGLVVVDTPDALLVIPRERAQDVRLVVEALQDAGRDDLL